MLPTCSFMLYSSTYRHLEGLIFLLLSDDFMIAHSIQSQMSILSHIACPRLTNNYYFELDLGCYRHKKLGVKCCMPRLSYDWTPKKHMFQWHWPMSLEYRHSSRFIVGPHLKFMYDHSKRKTIFISISSKFCSTLRFSQSDNLQYLHLLTRWDNAHCISWNFLFMKLEVSNIGSHTSLHMRSLFIWKLVLLSIWSPTIQLVNHNWFSCGFVWLNIAHTPSWAINSNMYR